MAEKVITDKDYLYLSTLLKARESNMLGRERMERMLMVGFAEAAKQLTDCGFEDMSELDSVGVDAELGKYRKDIFDELIQIVPEHAMVDAFRLKYDYHNAKVLVKAEGAGVDGENILSSSGRVDKRKLTDAFNADDYRFVPPALGKALQEAKSILARTGNPQLADFAVDRAQFAEMLEITKGLSSAYIHDYTRLLIDAANLKCCVRTMRMGRDQDFLRSALIPGGDVGTERLAQTVTSGDGVASAFAATPLREAAVLGAEAVKGGTMTRFELACDNAVTAWMTRAKTVGFGSEAVVVYLAGVEASIVAVRMILTGLLAGIEPERIKERLRDTYA